MSSAYSLAFDFGDEVQDVVTSFQGIVTGFTTYISGCDQYLVQPGLDKEGKEREGKWVDVVRLQVVRAGKVKLPRQPDNGCDIPAPIR